MADGYGLSWGGEHPQKHEPAVLTMTCLQGSLLWTLLFLPSPRALRAMSEGPQGQSRVLLPDVSPKPTQTAAGGMATGGKVHPHMS